MDEQLLREFLAEAEDLLEVLFGDIQTLRARHAEGRARRELIGRIFRHVHTIKGTAAAAGLDATGDIAHEFESLLDAVRMGRVAVDSDMLDAFGDAVEAIAQSLTVAVRGEEAVVPHALVERLRRLALADAHALRQTPEDAASIALAALPEDIAQLLSEYELHRLREAVGEGARLVVISVDFDLMTFDEQFRAMSGALAEGGEVVSTLPGMEAGAPDSITFRIVYAAHQDRETIAASIAPFNASLIEANREATANDDASQQLGATGESDEAEQHDERPENAATLSLAALTKMVRVPLDELDDLISTTHELFTDTIALLDLALTSDLARAARTELEIRSTRIRRRFVELEERLIELRMIPVGQTLERLARAGLSAARTMGKDIEIETKGGEVRLDKSLADAIADPLLHLLRNAVDHGIEPVEVRRRAGKNERGHVCLEASADGSRVILRITDDGGGIDVERIRRAAVARGLVGTEAQVDEQQALRMIFRPGFSTATEVSTVSGRGVGLDVVERAVEQIGGELRVRSRGGEGTMFEMRLPTTLALVPSLVVHSADNRYCVDASHIVEAGYAARSDTALSSDGTRVVHWRGALVPLVHLRTLLEQEEPAATAAAAAATTTTNDERLHIVISLVAGHETDDDEEEDVTARVAVVVDRWDGHSEVLVRGLGRHATRWRGVSGATELRDGTVALMLDLPRLLEMQL